jgi:hypothetical protein
MKKRVLIGIFAILLIVVMTLPGALVSANGGTSSLTVYYYAGMDKSTGPVSGVSVYLKTSGGANVASKGGVNGSTTFSGLSDGEYNVVSVKGASTRTDAVTVSGATDKNIPCGTLTCDYHTGASGAGDQVTGVTVYVNWAADHGAVANKGGVNGSYSFNLLSGDYEVVSVKGASTRTDSKTVASDQTLYVPCGLLVTNYNTENDGDDSSSGSGTDVTGVTVYVKWHATGGDVANKGGVNGSTSFALLAGGYDVVSVKGASNRTDGPYTVSSAVPANIPCGLLTVTYYANNNVLWGMTGVSVYVKWAADNGAVVNKGGVNDETNFALLDGSYSVVSVKGASSRTETGVSVASSQTLDVPVARFRVAIVKADFTAQTGVSVYVKTADNGDVTNKGGVNGSVDFSLLQSANGGGTGAGDYKFIATKGATTAQTTTSANEIPPAGPTGVILMLP